MAFHNKVCPQCNAKFLARKLTGTYCTPDCGQKHRRSLKRAQELQDALNAHIDGVMAEATQQSQQSQ